jgi:3-oxoacyl-[acyl-carrier protein] reductase
MPRLSQLSRSIASKVAIVTGAASGMGRATAHLFADEGAHVAVVDQNGDGVTQVTDEISAAGGSARGWALDITDAAALKTMLTEVIEKFGGLDILINNAGISRGVPIEHEDYEAAWARTFEVNLTAQVRLIRLALPHLLASEAGRIVNIASTEGLGASAFASPYTAAKHGVVGLTRSMAVELGARGITVNCICPGPIHTGMTAGIPDPAKTKFARRRVPARRYGEPEEVAHGTLNFVLPASSYINGVVMQVDGGLRVQNT